MQDTLLDRLFEGGAHAPLAGAGTLALAYDVRSHDGAFIAKNVSHARAQSVRTAWLTNFGVRSDIIESSTLGNDGKEIFVGTPTTFSHEPAHVSSDVPMFDVYIDNKIAARNLTADARDAFIIEYLDTDGIAPGQEIFDALTLNDLSEVFNIVVVEYKPSQNSAPTPQPQRSETGGWHGDTRKIGKAKATRIREFSYSTLPIACNVRTREEYHTHTVLDTATLDILHSGNETSAREFIANRVSQAGYKFHNHRVIHNSRVAKYVASVLLHGWRVTSHGETICTGTEKECRAFIAAGIADKRLTWTALSVERI